MYIFFNLSTTVFTFLFICIVTSNQVFEYMLDSTSLVYVINFLSQNFQNKTLGFLRVKFSFGSSQNYICFRWLVPRIMPSSLGICNLVCMVLPSRIAASLFLLCTQLLYLFLSLEELVP